MLKNVSDDFADEDFGDDLTLYRNLALSRLVKKAVETSQGMIPTGMSSHG